MDETKNCIGSSSSIDYTWIPLQFSMWIPCGHFPWITHGFHCNFPSGFHVEIFHGLHMDSMTNFHVDSIWNPWDLEDICQYFPWNIHVESIWIHGISIMEFPWITVGIHIDSTVCAVWVSIDRLLSTNAMVLNLFHVLHFDTDYCCVKVNFFNEFLCPTSVLMEHLPTLVELRSHNLHVPLLSLPYTQARNRLGGGFFLARSGGG